MPARKGKSKKGTPSRFVPGVGNGALQFLGSILLEVSAVRGNKPEDQNLPRNARHGYELRAHLSDDKSSAIAHTKLTLEISLGSEELLKIAATYQLEFEIGDHARSWKERLLSDTIYYAAMYHIWPYWLEYIHGTAARMGLPAFKLKTPDLPVPPPKPETSKL